MNNQSLKPENTDQRIKLPLNEKPSNGKYKSHFVLYIALLFFAFLIGVIIFAFSTNKGARTYNNTIDLRTKHIAPENSPEDDFSSQLPETDAPDKDDEQPYQNSESKSNLEELIQQIKPSIVFIELQNRYGFSGQGSGFFISKSGHILTCYHVIKENSNINIRYLNSDGEMRNSHAVALWSQKDKDIALIQVSQTDDFLPINLGKAEDIFQGHDIAAIGYPLGSFLGTDPTVTTGIISSIRRIGYKTDIFQISAPVNPGNSGGALISVATGEAIGIVNAKLNKAEGIGFAIPLTYEIRAFLNERFLNKGE